MLKIIKNPDPNEYDAVTEAVNNNSGYCPCRIEKTEDSKCPCKIFKEQDEPGLCHCGRFEKIEA